jgi:hypothetical protein
MKRGILDARVRWPDAYDRWLRFIDVEFFVPGGHPARPWLGSFLQVWIFPLRWHLFGGFRPENPIWTVAVGPLQLRWYSRPRRIDWSRLVYDAGSRVLDALAWMQQDLREHLCFMVGHDWNPNTYACRRCRVTIVRTCITVDGVDLSKYVSSIRFIDEPRLIDAMCAAFGKPVRVTLSGRWDDGISSMPRASFEEECLYGIGGRAGLKARLGGR